MPDKKKRAPVRLKGELPDIVRREVLYPKKMYEALKEKSDASGVAVVELVRRAVEEGFDLADEKEDKPPPLDIPLLGVIPAGELDERPCSNAFSRRRSHGICFAEYRYCFIFD